jgi:Methyltransferase domain
MPKPTKNSKPTAAQLLSDVLVPGQSIELLQALHIVTRDGGINQDSRRKLKQVQHLAQFIEPLIKRSLIQRPANTPLTLIDHGAGKAYLGFILYDLYLKQLTQDPGVQVWGIETRQDLVERAVSLAKTIGFDSMHFALLDTAQAVSSKQLPQHIDIVTALHACDIATDDALHFALARRAQHVVLVPCCQAEVARNLRQYKNVMLGKTALSELWRHPIHTREVGAQLTNVLRCLALESAGYDVTVTELVGWEHSLKNELIVATLKADVKTANVQALRATAASRLDELLETFGLQAMRARFVLAGTTRDN